MFPFPTYFRSIYNQVVNVYPLLYLYGMFFFTVALHSFSYTAFVKLQFTLMYQKLSGYHFLSITLWQLYQVNVRFVMKYYANHTDVASHVFVNKYVNKTT
jgi:hypothetical protein